MVSGIEGRAISLGGAGAGGGLVTTTAGVVFGFNSSGKRGASSGLAGAAISRSGAAGAIGCVFKESGPTSSPGGLLPAGPADFEVISLVAVAPAGALTGKVTWDLAAVD